MSEQNKHLLSQTNFPRLWTLFQYFIGGTIDKRKLCKLYFKDQVHVLEIGCSTGNIAKAFLEEKKIDYTGIDIDNAAIKYAKKTFKGKENFVFLNKDLRDFRKKTNKKYDYVLFAGIIHHINDEMSIKLFNAAADLLSARGILIIVEPLEPDKNDPKFIHYFMKIEQGEYVRTRKDMLTLVKKMPRLKLNRSITKYINATPWGFPVCAKFGIYRFNK